MRELKGKTILITRSRNQSDLFRSSLEEAGARVIELPTIAIEPLQSSRLDRAIDELESYHWLMFTSVNGVELFFSRLEQLGKVGRQMPQICAIGPATAAAVESRGEQVALLPSLYQAEGILHEFLQLHQGKIAGLRILLPRAARARRILPDTLRRKGAVVDVVAVYNTRIPPESRGRLCEILEQQAPDLITFTSSSTVHNFVALAPEDRRIDHLRYAAIGPITAATAGEYGLQVVVQPESFTIPDLVEAIRSFFAKGEENSVDRKE